MDDRVPREIRLPGFSTKLWPVAWRSDCGELDGDAWDAGLTRILQEVYSCLLDA